MNKNHNQSVLIIGDNPIKKHIISQYREQGVHVTEVLKLEQFHNNFNEIVLLTSNDINDGIYTDPHAIGLLNKLSQYYNNSDIRPIVHLLLQSPTSLWLMLSMDLPEEVNKNLDVYPFTIEDEWAKNVLVKLPGIRNYNYPSLDRTPIDIGSKQKIHAVISGFDIQAEAIALYIAMIAHFPNYRSTDKSPCRSRITIIDKDIKTRRDSFIARHQHLFDNSFYRFVDIDHQTIYTHRPQFYETRLDFVDIEWEFVEGSVNDVIVRKHISNWVSNKELQLSIFVSHHHDEKNVIESTSLPQCVYDKEIPIFVRQCNHAMTDFLSRSVKFTNIYPFGMKSFGYDVTLPYIRLAKLLGYFYHCSYSDQGVPTFLPLDEVEKCWQEQPSLKLRYSNLYNILTITTKMRSLGHDISDADTFYALTQKEIHDLAATEHNRWCVERLINGTRPCNDVERDEIRKNIHKKTEYKKRDIHYDLCAFEELQPDETGKNAQVYDYDLTACIPLIIKTFFDNKY